MKGPIPLVGAALEAGDIVCLTRKHCQATGQYAPPLNGKVTELVGSFVRVMWCDRDESVLVHPGNLIRYADRGRELA